MAEKATPRKRKRNNLVETLRKETTEQERNQIQNKMRLAARLIDLLSAKSWNQQKFAALLGKHPSEVTKWLSGTHNFTLDTLSDIATVLGIPLSELMAEKDATGNEVGHVVVGLKPTMQSINYLTLFKRHDSVCNRQSAEAPFDMRSLFWMATAMHSCSYNFTTPLKAKTCPA